MMWLSGSERLVSYVVIRRKPLTGSVDIGDKKQKSWLGYCSDSGIALTRVLARTGNFPLMAMAKYKNELYVSTMNVILRRCCQHFWRAANTSANTHV